MSEEDLQNLFDQYLGTGWRTGYGHLEAPRLDACNVEMLFQTILSQSESPQIMYVWSDNCKPDTPGEYWVKTEDGFGKIVDKHGIRKEVLSDFHIEKGVLLGGTLKITHWCKCKIEQTPILPKAQ